MKFYFLTLSVLLLCLRLFGQSPDYNMLVQSPDGKNVKLVWFVHKWSGDVTGFDVKRKDGLQGWVKLNKEAISPGISMKKNLSATGLNRSEENILKARLYKLLAGRKLKETDNNSMQQWSSNEKILHDMMELMAGDYEIALMNGFAFVDHTVDKKTDYQYGLFAQGTDRLLAKVSWNYGEIPDLNLVREITSKANTKTKGIRLIWNADLAKMKAGDVAGFNIYRQGIRLNILPIKLASETDPSEFAFHDVSANSSLQQQYSISAESVFGIEGRIRSYTYDPADHPGEYKQAEVTEINSLGYYFKEGIEIKWNFPKEQERFLKGFYIEKDNMPAGYVRVSALLEPSARVFVDKTPSPVTAYIRCRAVAVYNDRTHSNGKARVYSYFPVNEPPQPQNVTAKNVISDKKNIVQLNWEPKTNGDVVTDHYIVYMCDPSGRLFKAVNESHPALTNSFSYSIGSGVAGNYKFFVAAVSRSGADNASDTVSVQVASTEMPVPVISKIRADSNCAFIQWQYPDIQDLKGFRLFQDENLIAGENKLNKGSRNFRTAPLEQGANYQFTVRAVSENGILSELSTPAPLSIPASEK